MPKLPFFYGSSEDEWESISFAYARVNAFSSKSALPCSYKVFSIGSVVRGLIEKAHSDYETAQLAVNGSIFLLVLLSISFGGRWNTPIPSIVGWSIASANEWKLLSPTTFFEEGLELDTNAIYQLPVLHNRCFPSDPDYYIDYCMLFQPDKLQADIQASLPQLPLPAIPRPARFKAHPVLLTVPESTQLPHIPAASPSGTPPDDMMSVQSACDLQVSPPRQFPKSLVGAKGGHHYVLPFPSLRLSGVTLKLPLLVSTKGTPRNTCTQYPRSFPSQPPLQRV